MKRKNSDKANEKRVNYFGGDASKKQGSTDWDTPFDDKWSSTNKDWNAKGWNEGGTGEQELLVEEGVSKQKKIRNRSGTPKRRGGVDLSAGVLGAVD